MAKRCPRCLESLTPVNECVCLDDEQDESEPWRVVPFTPPPKPYPEAS
jgi:hypothetical protein